jgi:hypothetical protein
LEISSSATRAPAWYSTARSGACFELGFDFAVEVVFFVFGFPIAVGEVKGVEQGSVYDDASSRALDGELRNESEMELASAVGEEFGEGVADLGFVAEVELSDLVEGGVVVLDRGVRRFEGERHILSGEA